MIETLRIENLAIVESAQLEFGEGLNVVTGETGAGKSIVLGALGLLAGTRASQEWIRDGAEEAVVEAVFRTDAGSELAAELERRGIACEADELVVRRSVARSGRSRARVAGELVPISTLAELFAGRLEISSQHESQELLRPGAHGWLLDACGELLPQRERVAAAHAQLREIQGRIDALRNESEERARREDFLRYQMSEIEEAKLRAGESAELGVERERLAHAERLASGAAESARWLVGDPAAPEALGAIDALSESVRRLDDLAPHDPALEAWAGRLQDAHAELDDVARELERYASAIEADPARLGEVEDRLALLQRLRRKYGPDEDTILAFCDAAERELLELGCAEDRLSELAREEKSAAARLRRAAARLSTGRRRAAEKLASELGKRLRDLAMADARFEVGLEAAPAPARAPCGPGGSEVPEFRFSANPGEPPQALRRVASGGELSRVFLAVKGALRGSARGMVLVFDEVDAGIGGQVADRVGRLLADLARRHQVLCITHLPQIAALADLHLHVSKRSRGGRTVAATRRLEGEAKVDEIARMAGGEKVGEATRRHARELLRSRKG